MPKQLEPVSFGGFAFWNVVVCALRGMRPVPLPEAVGIGYWHVAYRLYARARLADGRAVEGLYFVRSDCDRWIVAALGNWLSDFRFHLARIAVSEIGSEVHGRIDVRGAAARFHLDRAQPVTLSPGSPFATIEDAAAFLKYEPLALSPFAGHAVSLMRVEREESAWRSRLIATPELHWDFFDGKEVVPELCYEVEPIDYRWNAAEILQIQR
ncbi:MAG: DUF2071 domain-containing protein [Verrucomicrobiota bacterium]|nr:DUF2071 domain-containing protein [Verrucomicrobiota bacterium]